MRGDRRLGLFNLTGDFPEECRLGVRIGLRIPILADRLERTQLLLGPCDLAIFVLDLFLPQIDSALLPADSRGLVSIVNFDCGRGAGEKVTACGQVPIGIHRGDEKQRIFQVLGIRRSGTCDRSRRRSWAVSGANI